MKNHSFHILAVLLALGCSSQGPTQIDSGSEDETGVDVPPPDVTDKDTGPTDTGPRDTGPRDTGPADSGPMDVGSPEDVPADAPQQPDVVAADAGDAGSPDAPLPDVPLPDVPPMDAGAADVPALDVVPADTGSPDVARTDGGPTDAPVADAVDAAPCIATVETCNDRDDDCDGLIDESSCGTHLLISEVVAGPNEAEYIEIHNPTAAPINLSNVYLTDFNDYACVLGGTCTIPGRMPATLGGSDFVARFPDGAVIMPGAYATVATGQPADFPRLLNGACPTYYFARATSMLGACTASLPMRTVPGSTTSIGSTAGVTNDGEPITLFQWNGTSPLVQDLDYVVHGAPSTANAQVDKSGVMVTFMGMTGTYRADTPVAMQQQGPRFANGGANVRCHLGEGAETRTGGNGATGHDETSERFMVTWRATTPALPVGDAGLSRVNASPNAANECR